MKARLWLAALLWLSCSGDPHEAILQGESLYSAQKEELIIRHFFGDRRGGFFVDVGAYDWKVNSTTLYLEKHLDWTGIAVDALSELRMGYVRNRPGTKFFNYIVNDRSGELGTLFAAGVVSSTVEGHLDEFEAAGAVVPHERKVPTITLNDLLDREGVQRLDLLSMDIEQGEPAALAGFDIERFRPELVCIEMGHPEVRAKVAPYFERHGYERIDAYLEHDATNWYYRPK